MTETENVKFFFRVSADEVRSMGGFESTVSVAPLVVMLLGPKFLALAAL